MFNTLLFRIKRKYKHLFDSPLQFSSPQVEVAFEMIGDADYGGWATVVQGLSSQSIVYSFGIGENASWDEAMIKRFGMNIHAFDPTPRSIEWVKKQPLSAQFRFQPYGLASYDGEATFYPPPRDTHVSHTVLYQPDTAHRAIRVPMKKLPTIMRKLGHMHIDVLKMDIEGAEGEVLKEILDNNIPVNQILVEFYPRFISNRKVNKIIKLLNRKNYKIFHVSPHGDYCFTRTFR